MAKDSEEPFRLKASQLYEATKKRSIIPCTLSSDIGLGGGIPLGATVLIGGRQKLGKTTFCLQCAANAQKLFNSKVFIFPIEGRLTHQVMGQVQGLQMDKVEVINPPAIFDKNGDVIGFKKFTAEKWFEIIGETIINNPGSVIIVDSLANLSSEKEQSENMGFQDRGGRNKLEAEFCRKYGNLVIPNRVTLFLIAQVQANTSGYGPPIQMKVGNQIKFQADIIMMGKSIEKWDEQNGRILGHDMNYIVECSALGPPFMDIKIPLRYGYGIDNLKDVVVHSINWQLIQKSGAWYTLPFVEVDGNVSIVDLDNLEEGVKPVKVQGEPAIRNWLLIHPEQAKYLENIIRSKIFGEENGSK